MRVISTLVLLALLGAATAHICSIDPPQRGDFSITTPGDPSCYRRTPYCGGIDVEAPKKTYIAGEETTFTFQQNLNHWNWSHPGHFEIGIAYSSDPSIDDFLPLARFSDFAGNEMVTQTNFTVPVKLPYKTCEHCVIGFKYISNNGMEIDPKTNTDAIFYNCADVAVISGVTNAMPSNTPSVKKEDVMQKIPDLFQDSTSCTLPGQFTMELLETNNAGTVRHRVWWDSNILFTRWDKMFLDDSSRSNLILINNYNRPVEYVIQESAGTCDLYGNDKFYTWTYGATAGQSVIDTFKNADGVPTYVFQSKGSDFRFVVESLNGSSTQCKPVSWTVGESSFTVLSFDVGAPDSSVFTVPSICNSKKAGVVTCGGQSRMDELIAIRDGKN